MAESSRDIQIDAVPADIQMSPNDENAPFDPGMFSKVRAQKETEIPHEDNMMNYIQYFPPDLKNDDFDIVILYADKDYNGAKSLKKLIEQNVKFCNGVLTPRVILLDDVITDEIDPLEYAFRRTLYLFIYATEEFCNQYFCLLQSHSCLKRALDSKEEKWSVIPIHTSPKQTRKYTLPLMLDGLRPLNLFSKTFNQDVMKLLEHKSDVIFKRMADKKEKRKEYFNTNWDLILKMSGFLNGKAESAKVSAQSTREKLSGLSVHGSTSKHEGRLQNTTSAKASMKQEATDPISRSLQLQQQVNQHSSEQTLPKSRSYLGDHLSSITTDGASEAGDSEDSNGNAMSSEHNIQQQCEGLHGKLASHNKVTHENYYSDAVEMSTLSVSSLPEPDGDKAVPGDYSVQEHGIHSQDRVSDGQTISNASTGNHPETNEGAQRPYNRITQNRPHRSVNNTSEYMFSNPLRDLPQMSRPSMVDTAEGESASVLAGPIHFHINATNVVIGKHGIMNILSSQNENQDSDDTDNADDESSHNI